MYWEYYFFRIVFFAFMLLVSSATAVIGAVAAILRDKWRGGICFFSKMAFAIAWGSIAVILLPYIETRHSVSFFAIYTVWGFSGAVPFIFSLFQTLKNKLNNRLAENIWGIITVLTFFGSLSTVIYYSCVENGILQEKELFGYGCIKLLFLYFMLLSGIVFMPVFALFSVILGILRKRFSVFLKNLLLLSVPPAGLVLLALMIYHRFDKNQAGRFAVYAVIFIWIVFMIIPYGLMLWRGKKEKNEMIFYNGVAGVWAFIFFMLLLGFAYYLGRF